MIQPVGYPATPPRKKRPVWVTGGITIVSFVALLYIIEVVNQLSGDRLDENGIRPLEADGLWGIVFAPLLHASWQHLIANTGPALVLGFLMTLAGLSRFIFATAIIWILGGFGTWLIGEVGSTCGVNSNIIGASGLIFGWLTFLLVFGWFTRNLWEIIIGLIVLFIYGGILWGAVPVQGCTGISWQGHLCGGIAGVLAAYLLSSPERKARALRRGRATTPPMTR
ncbi:rhomboid family intramembrane serine protease [Mycobacterium sp.]|jgi:membrane associated rhomboid family serine protease|uniref:rhomboid family intramembrane serine protease n=1 Tax=Mycobacterium sp. TaxID=1785 RepID=UPI002D3EB629|nr:rhomboid family intramembrane serine protease [Mycobacterium sp.]HZA12612.1 rhomboid family intramembrane serine protease [Mycobacterium sp.]